MTYKKKKIEGAFEMEVEALEGKDNVPDTNVGDTISREEER